MSNLENLLSVGRISPQCVLAPYFGESSISWYILSNWDNLLSDVKRLFWTIYGIKVRFVHHSRRLHFLFKVWLMPMVATTPISSILLGPSSPNIFCTWGTSCAWTSSYSCNAFNLIQDQWELVHTIYLLASLVLARRNINLFRLTTSSGDMVVVEICFYFWKLSILANSCL